jgi:hypothetical protein
MPHASLIWLIAAQSRQLSQRWKYAVGLAAQCWSEMHVQRQGDCSPGQRPKRGVDQGAPPHQNAAAV